MTQIYLTDEDYEILNAGDINEIKRRMNEIRGELVELKNAVKNAVHTADITERMCKLRASIHEDKP